MEPPPVYTLISHPISRIFGLGRLLGGSLVCALHVLCARRAQAMLGWGRKPSARRAQHVAAWLGVPMLYLEDGFVRSFGTGRHFPPLSLVADEEGIYYDATRPSALESLLNGERELLLPGLQTERIRRARTLLVSEGLSKYNHAPDLPADALRSDDVARVLVVDQTAGDMSVALGGADAGTFTAMLAAALAENPEATIYVKTHPEVSSGQKSGYLSAVKDGERCVVLRVPVSPPSLMAHMDKVYVVTSTMGFEALLAGKPVVCFGMPWYAGWGVTQDRQRCIRRTRKRSVDELFAAAYLHYARYLDPFTRECGDLESVVQWLKIQREVACRFPARMICVGFPAWRQWNFHCLLSLFPGQVLFVGTASEAAALEPRGKDCLVCWGRVPPDSLEAVAHDCGVRLLRLEDGFVRSVGLGSDLIPPQSFVLDAKGIYFDPGQPSELEDLLNTRIFTAHDTERAQYVRSFIVRHGITKYNLEPLQAVDWPRGAKLTVLVPGQVEDDASIRFGCDAVHGVHTNLGLLQAARQAYPDAFVVYKPHPDVVSGNRRGRLALEQAQQWADHVETRASVVSCIEACDVVVTMTSLTGFDALLRGKTVVVHGRPFYAGWGLTQDMLAVPRRQRCLSLDELVAGVLLHYPLYWDPCLRGYTTCEAVLHQLLERREALERSGRLQHLRSGHVRRLGRKLAVVARAALSR